MRRFLIPILLAAAGLLVALQLVPAEQATVDRHLKSFPDADPFTQQLRPVILGVICFMPALGGLLYAMGGTLARYVTRQFLALLAICLLALMVIWLLVDLQDNIDDLKHTENMGQSIAQLYSVKVPELIVTLLPYALLLSLLFCLGRLSQTREIVAMIQSGRGLARVATPFLITGAFAAILCAALNYQWAPQAKANEKKVLERAKGFAETEAQFVQFRNPRVRRLWMVGSFPPDYQLGAPLQDVRIITENKDGTLKSIMVAESATWNGKTDTWTFHNSTLKKIRPNDPPLYVQDHPNPYVVVGWRETPSEIIQPGLPAIQLGIPQLAAWLNSAKATGGKRRTTHLTQWHHRFSQPFNCLILVILAAPLGVVFSRRGASSGVAMAVFLSAGLFFLTSVCLTLGDAGYLPPILAAWLPNLAFGALAIYLFRRRLAGRPIYQTIRKILPNEA